MQKLYVKNELWFALVWIAVYVAGCGWADAFSHLLGVEKVLTFPFLLLLCFAALHFVKKQGLLEKYGFCRPVGESARYLFYLPLAGLASCNLWFGTASNLSAAETALYIGSMLCVGLLEELIFRGFLFKAMLPGGVRSAILVSSITFGLGHIVNLINGSGADLLSNLCQVCYAMAAGLLFAILFYRGKSLWPCIITHSILNALSAFADEAAITSTEEIISAVTLTVLSLGYAWVLHHTLPKEKQPERAEQL